MKRTKKLFTVTDLGGGDGGKGGVVHKICDLMHAHTVVKVGGAQGSHGVQTSNGDKFNFSQFGCGTFGGTRTHISRNLVIDPNGILNEGTELQYQHGVRNAFDLLTVDEEALCITPYHGIASRLRELARRDNPKGTIGIGVGEAFYDAELFPALVIRAKDLGRSDLRKMLETVREQKLVALKSIIDGGFWKSDLPGAERQIGLLDDPGLIDWTLERFQEMHRRVKIVDRDYLKREVLAKDGTVVVESSHGILTDRFAGFHPHTSKLRTLPRFTHDMIRECGYDGQVINLGVTRAYQIRHGAGPMVTESPEMVENLLPGSNKDENRFQGKVRVGPLDFVALRYAIEVCGGPSAFDGLAISWFDQIRVNQSWKVCGSYVGADNQTFFTPSGAIRVRRGEDDEQLAYQERLGNLLRQCKPVVTEHSVPVELSQKECVALCDGVLREKLGLPVKMMSFGATEREKVCL